MSSEFAIQNQLTRGWMFGKRLPSLVGVDWHQYFTRPLAEVRRGDVEAADRWFADAIATVDASESRMSQAVVRLARAIGHEALGTPAAVELRVDAERALEDLGVHPTGWDTAFRLAAGFSGSVPEAAGSR